MKIENVEVINLRYEAPAGTGFWYAGGQMTGRVTTLVRLTLSTGLVGWGAAYTHPILARVIVEGHLKARLLGADPTDVEGLWHRMYRETRWYGRKGAAMSVLGAIDIALWDIRGKILDQPICDLLGTDRRSVPAYASALLWSDANTLSAEASALLDRGFRRMKMRAGRDWEYDVSAVQAIRRSIGSSNDLIVDGSMRFDPISARAFAKILKKEAVFWFEEPFEPHELDDYAALINDVEIPVSAGENEFGFEGFDELIQRKAVDIVQPDASRCGGITVAAEVSKRARTAGLGCATHTWSDGVALMANMHVVAASSNGISVEVDCTNNPFIDEIFKEPLKVKDGAIEISSRPGLGVEIDEGFLKKFAMHSDYSVPDGLYSDFIFGEGRVTELPVYGETVCE